MGIIKKLKSVFGMNSQTTPIPVTPPLPPSPPPITYEEMLEIKRKERQASQKPKDVIQFCIVGTYYRGADARDRRDSLIAGEKLRLRKDKRNRYSDTALRVYTNDDVWIGFVDDGHSSRIWKDMEGDECEAVFVESVIGDDQIWFDDDGNMHERHYDQDDNHIAYYRIPHFEEKQQEKAKKRKEDAALKDLQTPEGRMEPEDIDYKSLPREELQKMKKSALSKLRGRKKKEEEGEIPESGPVRELYEIQIANIGKLIQRIEEAL